MIVQKKGNTHDHVLRRAYRKDVGVPNNTGYSKGRRYILLWVCIVKGCPFQEAYDLTHEEQI
jgi:hypothetical protein